MASFSASVVAPSAATHEVAPFPAHHLNSGIVGDIPRSPANRFGMNKFNPLVLGLKAFPQPAGAVCQDWRRSARRADVYRK